MPVAPSLPRSTAIQRPALPAEIKRPLHGHSGATLVLHIEGSHCFVRKTAGHIDGNMRLLQQAEKQRRLAQVGIPFPRVLATGIDTCGLAFFEMAYVPGMTVAGSVIEGLQFDVKGIADAVERIIWLFRSCAAEPLPDERFHTKIAQIEMASRERSASDPELAENIRACSKRLSSLDWSAIPESLCHGDLTLENIMLIPEEGVTFIDCDDAWVSSFWLDLGKLFQDVIGHWCIRGLYAQETAAVQLSNAVQKLEQLANIFSDVATDADPLIAERLPQLAALNLFRALPYARDPYLPGFICRQINDLLE